MGANGSTDAGPTALTWRSWKDALKRSVDEARHDQLQHWAAALTFYGVLSIFPALLVMVSLVSLLADPSRVTQFLIDTLTELGPTPAERTIQGPVESLAGRPGAAGTALVVGLIGGVWAASAYVGGFGDACNVIYEVEEGRPFWKRKAQQLGITLVLIVLATAVALALVVSGPLVAAIGSGLGVGDAALTVWRLAKWPAMALLVVAIFVVVSRTTPNARLPGPRWQLPGAVAFLLVWIAASAIFTVYVDTLGTYGRTYGALGGVAVFLLWMFISNLALLLGVECNAEIERSRQLEAGERRARRSLQLEEREPPGPRLSNA